MHHTSSVEVGVWDRVRSSCQKNIKKEFLFSSNYFFFFSKQVHSEIVHCVEEKHGSLKGDDPSGSHKNVASHKVDVGVCNNEPCIDCAT